MARASNATRAEAPQGVRSDEAAQRELIREKRGQEGLTQKELAIRAFDDESKVRRIIELEKGSVKRPHVKTVDALKVYFNITNEEIEKCRSHGLFTSSEQLRVGLSRNLMENLAQRFEHDNPDAPDEELISHLKAKADEIKRLEKRLSNLESTTASLHNQITSANAALEVGLFDEADRILAAAEEIQQEQRTIKEIRTQSQIRFARGDTALLSGQSSTAAAHYVKAAEYFLGFDKTEVAKILGNAAGQIYEIETRRHDPRFADALDLATRALVLISPDASTSEWIRAKYHLALLQQVESRARKPKSSDLLNQAIANIHEARR